MGLGSSDGVRSVGGLGGGQLPPHQQQPLYNSKLFAEVLPIRINLALLLLECFLSSLIEIMSNPFELGASCAPFSPLPDHLFKRVWRVVQQQSTRECCKQRCQMGVCS